MEIQEILEYNKRCAEFLDWKFEDEIWLKPHPKEFNRWIVASYSKTFVDFCYDWNWIMEVINEILKIYRTDFYLDFDMPVSDTFTVSIGSDGKYNSRGESNVSSKEAVVQAINQFLIWYNNEH